MADAFTAGDPFAFLQQQATGFEQPAQPPVSGDGQQGAPPTPAPPQQPTPEQQVYYAQIQREPQQSAPQAVPQVPPQAAPQQAPVQQPGETQQQWQQRYEEYRQQVESLNPILGYINQDPSLAQDIFRVIEEKVRPQQKPEPEPEAPKAPERPGDYNEAEAYSDPTSASWRYRVQNEDYRFRMAEFRAEQAERRAQKLEQTIQQRAQQTEEEQRQAQLAQDAYARALQAGLQPQQAQQAAQDFVRFVTQPQVSQDDLWALYQLKTRQQQQLPQPLQTMQQLGRIPNGTELMQQPVQMNFQPNAQQRSPALQYPVPSVAHGGASVPLRSPDDQLFDALLAVEERSNPWAPRTQQAMPQGMPIR